MDTNWTPHPHQVNASDLTITLQIPSNSFSVLQPELSFQSINWMASLLTYTLKTLNVKSTLPVLQSTARLSPAELYLYFPHAYTLWPVPVAFCISLVEPATGIL